MVANASSALGTDRYARVFYEIAGQCYVSEVIITEPATINQYLEAAHGSTAPQDGGQDLAMCFAARHSQGGWDFDTDLNTSIEACGNCNTNCIRPNMDSSCNSGSCAFGACDANWVDLNENTDDGCECQITQGGADTPEFVGPFYDTNCDGIDGTLSNSILVAPSGSNTTSCGTAYTTPCQTINYGLTRAVSTGRSDVLIAQGSYTELVTLQNGKNLYGGYSTGPMGWARSESNETTILGAVSSLGHGEAVVGASLSSTTNVNQVTIIAPNATAAGASSYGVRCSNCSGLRLRYVRVTAGSGARGADGTYVGGNGAGGGSGVAGGGGSDDGSGSPGAKAGGVSTCGRPGGNSGAGGSRGSSTGSAGAHGTVWGSGGGSRGDGGSTGSRCGHADGSRGFGGDGGAVPAVAAGGVNGSASGGLWTGASGATGATGNAGHGGGGGGGGTGQGRSNISNWCVHGAGNSGGSGGAGGCPGLGGAAGTAGGGSFAVFLVNSSGAVVGNSWLTTSAGGDGGSGMRGGDGGDGGAGGNGGAATDGKEIGWGGGGGGGGGGSGGAGGGGGAGGPSVGIAHTGGAITASANAVVRGASGQGGVGGGISSGGDAGSGGPHSKNGGLSGTSGTAGVSGPAGGNGATGAAQDIWSF